MVGCVWWEDVGEERVLRWDVCGGRMWVRRGCLRWDVWWEGVGEERVFTVGCVVGGCG